MAVAFLSESYFEKHERDDIAMEVFLLFDTVDGPTDFYFAGDNGFVFYALGWGKEHQKRHPGSRMLCVASDHEKPTMMKLNRLVFDEVICLDASSSGTEGLSAREKYVIDQCDTVIIYRYGGVDDYESARYAKKKDKRVTDYYTERKELFPLLKLIHRIYFDE